jgi:predicted P-loop ATPase
MSALPKPMATVNAPFAARQYVAAGFALVPIPFGSKGPMTVGWNMLENCVTDDERAAKMVTGIGLAHAYSKTACVDLDDLTLSRLYLFEQGVDLDSLLNAPDAVQVTSGRPNRAKLLYKLPEGVEPLLTIKLGDYGLELRCGTREGLTVQDCLPPTMHPLTNQPYSWAGAGDWQALPTMPDTLLAAWQQAIEEKGPARLPGGVPDGDPNDDPMVKHLDNAGWTRRTLANGTRHIRCPFEDQHTSKGSIGECSYFPARTGGYANGHFHCHHAHCDDRTDEEFEQAVGYDHLAMLPALIPAIDATPDPDNDLPTDPPWPPLVRDRNGRILATIHNTVKALDHVGMATMTLGYDSFRDEIMYSIDRGVNWIPFKDCDYTTLRIELEKKGFKPVSPQLIRDAVARVAQDNTFDSAQQWLRGLPTWDGVPRIDTFLPAYFGAENSDYTRAVSGYAWTAQAGRILEPGVKADMVPTLIGAQGLRKSTGVAVIAPAQDFFCEISLADKEVDLARKMRGRLVGELSELRGLHSRELEHIKAFVTRTFEDWTPKYKEFNVTFPRRILFWGTSNEQEFLGDETGNRRWLPVTVNQVDVEGIERDRSQLWAEARARFQLDGVLWQDAERLARDQHDAHMISDSWANTVGTWLGQNGPDGLLNSARPYLLLEQVLIHAIGFDARQISRREELRMGRVLRSLGYHKKDHRDDGKKFKAWFAGGAT